MLDAILRRFLLAGLEQCSLRGGMQVEVGDIARAAVLVVPDLYPTNATVVELPRRPVTTRDWSPEVRPLIEHVLEQKSRRAEPRVDLADVVNRLPEAAFGFEVVETTGWWRDEHSTTLTLAISSDIERVTAVRREDT